MKTAQRMKNTQMSILSTVCIASECCSRNKSADGDVLFLTLGVFVQSLQFVSCVVFISCIKLFSAFGAVSFAPGATVLGLACRNDSLALKLFGY